MNVSNLSPSGDEKAGVGASSYMPILESIAIFKEIPEDEIMASSSIFALRFPDDPVTNLFQDLTEEVVCLKV